MLEITLPSMEFFDEEKSEFSYYSECTISLEHSLVSLSKWESKWEKPFLSSTDKTDEQTLDYVRFMVVSPTDLPEDLIWRLNQSDVSKITEYINSKQSATWFEKEPGAKKGSEAITSELIYYWMISMQIPVEFETWHLNRLMTLIRVCQKKNQPGKKMSQKDLRNKYRELNAQRKAKLNTRG